jgi:hypothetical protein
MLPKVGLIRPATVRVRSKRLPRQDAARTAAKHSINCELVYAASAYSRLICGADDDFLLGKLAARGFLLNGNFRGAERDDRLRSSQLGTILIVPHFEGSPNVYRTIPAQRMLPREFHGPVQAAKKLEDRERKDVAQTVV